MAEFRPDWAKPKSLGGTSLQEFNHICYFSCQGTDVSPDSLRLINGTAILSRINFRKIVGFHYFTNQSNCITMLNNRALIASCLLVIFLLSCQSSKMQIEVVERPHATTRNAHYISNRAPLQPSSLIKLPVGAIKPSGWLLEMLNRQNRGLTGNLNKIGAW